MVTHYITNLAGAVGDNVIVYLPRLWKANESKPAIILCGGTNDSWTLGFKETHILPVARSLTDAGYAVGWSDFGINQYGNQNALNRIDALRSYLQSSTIGAKTDKIAIAGFSMGGLNALSYAGNHPSKILSLTGWCPLVDMQQAYANPDIKPYIDAAYGGNWSEAGQGATSNPMTMAAAGKFNSFLTELRYANNDPVIPANTVTQLTTTSNSPNVTAVNVGNLGHSWSVVNNQLSIEALIQQLAQAEAR